jgi:hypothetical protein
LGIGVAVGSTVGVSDSVGTGEGEEVAVERGTELGVAREADEPAPQAESASEIKINIELQVNILFISKTCCVFYV